MRTPSELTYSNGMGDILILGSKGFMGTHLVSALTNRRLPYIGLDADYTQKELFAGCRTASHIIHLAGLMRPVSDEEFTIVNDGLTMQLIHYLEAAGNRCPIFFASSIQASLNNPYGRAKARCEELLRKLQQDNGNPVYIYRLSNAFGPGGKPNYNSVLATFCYNILRDLPITIRDPNCIVPFVYVGDIVDTILGICEETICPSNSAPNHVLPIYPCSLGKLAKLIYAMKEAALTKTAYPTRDDFEKKLFITLCSYAPGVYSDLAK